MIIRRTSSTGTAHSQNQNSHGHDTGALSAVDSAVDGEHLRESLLVGELWLAHVGTVQGGRHVAVKTRL